MSKVIKLADYRNLEAHIAPKKAVTDEDVTKQIEDMMANRAHLEPKEGCVGSGDTTTIDFEGFKDGVPFDGGKAENYQLEIGSHQFIPGFEEQMIGMEKGETRDLHLTFPENYPVDNLAGAPVIFKVTVHEISQKVQDELTDAFIVSLNIPEITTVEAFRDYTHHYLEDQAEKQLTTEKENAVLDLLIARSEVELDDHDLALALANHIAHIEMDLKAQGFSLDQYLQMTGMSREAMEDQLQEPAKQQAKFEAIIDEIVRVENIQTTDEEIEQQAAAIASHNQIRKEDVLERIQPEDFKRDINRVKASQIVLTTARFIFE